MGSECPMMSVASATGFIAFIGFHPTDQGNYVRFPVRARGEGGCVYALPPLIKAAKAVKPVIWPPLVQRRVSPVDAFAVLLGSTSNGPVDVMAWLVPARR